MASKPRTNSLSVEAAGAPATPAAERQQAPKSVRPDCVPAASPITATDRNDVLCMVRQVFGAGDARDRETALRDIATALGYTRLGPKTREILEADLVTAVRRGILKNEDGELSLLCRGIGEYDRAFLKEQFLASMGRTWCDRDEAVRAFARWLGFSRTGPAIEETTRSLINGLLREGRLETDGANIRRI